MYYGDITIQKYVFQFYSKALAFPYEEMGLELQHIFRQMEVGCQSPEDEQLAARILQVINHLQGEETATLQGEYTRMFTHEPGGKADVSLYISDYCDETTAEKLSDRFFESDLADIYDEEPDTITHLLNYAAEIAEADYPSESIPQLTTILNPFSQYLYKGSTVSFYKELAKGLSEICLVLSD